MGEMGFVAMKYKYLQLLSRHMMAAGWKYERPNVVFFNGGEQMQFFEE